MAALAIEVESLEKRFGPFVAVNRISFDVRAGEIFGFLGANGAGKSTTIRMLCGLLGSTSGTARVAGYDINDSPDRVKENIGYMSQKFSLYGDLTVIENIRFFGATYGLSSAQLRRRMDWTIETAGLSRMLNSLTSDLPGGWKQRLAFGCAFLHKPKIVFLDEPTSGVDPISRRRFWELINTVSAEGTTVFVTTHYLDEAEYCNDIMLMHAGKLIAGGSPRDLKKTYIDHPMFEVECDDPLRAVGLLKQHASVSNASVFGSYIHVGVLSHGDGENAVRGILSAGDIGVSRIEPVAPSLEDVFIHLIERESGADT